MAHLRLADGRELELSRPLVMAILNATPDSFSDGGQLARDLDGRIRAAAAAGADLLDVGGESTRPGHTAVSADEELLRVVPVVEACRRLAPDVPVSIDTRKPVVAEAALDAGAALVNDVSGMDDPEMAELVLEHDCAIVLMRHQALVGSDVVAACRRELGALVARARDAGIPDDAIVLDPGLGFGDPPGGDVAANRALLRGVSDYGHGFPVLVGASRKRFLAQGEPEPARRLAPSVAAAVEAVQAGAAIVRVHDVKETVDALRMAGWRT